MRFSKWHALGNAYLVAEDLGHVELGADVVRRLCDPRVGIGADGVLEIAAAGPGRADVVIWNPDGSTSGMSGNGTRIAAAWLASRRGVTEVAIATGAREVVARIRADGVIEQEIEPVVVGALETLDVDGLPFDFVPVDLGNPHAVSRTASYDELTLQRLGPFIETHPRFPDGTNVQLVLVEGSHDVRCLVWERGAGATSASGSSAVAVAAAAIAQGWCETPVRVHFPGGDLEVEIHGARATLTGPVEEICRGETTF